MQLIDHTYFTGEIHVSQKSQPAVLEKLNGFIQKYEAEALDKILGVRLADAFLKGLEVEEGQTVAPEWADLLNGTVYEFNGKSYRWQGFKNDRKSSILANYVYYHYTADMVSQAAGIGQVKPLAENAATVSPGPKMVRAWNEMVDWLSDLWRFLYSRPDVYAFNRCEASLFLGKINGFGI